MEILCYPFFQKALLAGALVSILCGLISVFVVLRRMSFIGAGISHAAFGGVAAGFFFGFNPVISAVIYAILTAFFINEVVKRGKVSEDTAIGIFFSASMALGVIFIGLSKNYTIDLFGYLFGNILTVETNELYLMLGCFALIFLLILANFKRLYITSFNEELAYVSGINTKATALLLLIILSFIIVLSMKVVGLILVSALLVIPAACAKTATGNIYAMTLLSMIIAVLGTFSGLALSFYFDLPSGGTIVMVLALVFFGFLSVKIMIKKS